MVEMAAFEESEVLTRELGHADDYLQLSGLHRNFFCPVELSTGQKMILNLLYDMKRSEQMASLSDQNDIVELRP
jgi:hypothetical protein